MEPVVIEIKDYPLHFIDICGRVWSKKGRELRLLKPFKKKHGYFGIYLSCNHKIGRFLVHRLVAQAFIPNPHCYPYVLHSDDNPANNRVDNLFWGTQKMNLQQAAREGHMVRDFKGEKNGHHKLNEKQVKLIRMMYDIFKWKKCKILKLLGIPWGVKKSAIYQILDKRHWKYI